MPDYRGRFLRGLQPGHSVGQTVANSIKSHNHTQPTHTHSFSGQLVSTALTGTATGQKYSSSVNLTVSGTAAGQRYSDSGILWTTNYYDATGVTNGSGPIRSSHISSNTTTKQYHKPLHQPKNYIQHHTKHILLQNKQTQFIFHLSSYQIYRKALKANQFIINTNTMRFTNNTTILI